MEADGNGIGGKGGYPVAENWCSTDIGEIEFSFIWTINKFSQHPEKMGEYLESSIFSCGTGDDETKWSLKVYPNGDQETAKDYVSIFATLMESKSPEVRAKMKISMINDEREKINTHENVEKRVAWKKSPECDISQIRPTKDLGDSRFKRGSGLGYTKFISREALLNEASGLLPEDRLTIFCKGTVLTKSINVSGQCSLGKFQIPECQISTDLYNLLDSEAFYDCTIFVNSVNSSCQFPVYKGILSSRSPVFKAMFENEMEEKLDGRVEIKDFEPDVVEKMLEFMYTGSVINLKLVAKDLLAAADKYQLERLKVMCEIELCRSVTTENACQTLTLADLHSAEQLKAYVLNFISDRRREVGKTSGWENMVQERPHLLSHFFLSGKHLK